ncbi:uncharacterized protein LOC111829305 [Capsella rubella]|uniref:uncharacterized protein LOC111829305 n=1 Tax=Capsella rubella TaxID=81985 RepID=UPI000CD5B964|nr:uncharacterized protein LOC111829305 [Capsella rubella]
MNQRLWKIDGQTMFVADWEPGMAPVNPELTIAPIWLELRNVPLQCFNEEGLEHIAGLVGHPDCLHPDTKDKSNLEVAKVFTFIDPRKPLPEGVNVQFDSGEIRRVVVSSPWMPPICPHYWEPGMAPVNPELTIAPIWLELRNVPLQCFNEEGLEHIAGLVGHPDCLHPDTKDKSNLEVAKARLDESLGHSLKRCKTAPITCKNCNSTSHPAAVCPRIKGNGARKPLNPKPNVSSGVVPAAASVAVAPAVVQSNSRPVPKDKEKVRASSAKSSQKSSQKSSEGDSDSTDINSSEEEARGFLSEEEHEFLEVVSKKNRRDSRGFGPKRK